MIKLTIQLNRCTVCLSEHPNFLYSRSALCVIVISLPQILNKCGAKGHYLIKLIIFTSASRTFEKWNLEWLISGVGCHLNIMLQYVKLLSCWGLILCVFLSLASFEKASCHESHSNRKQIEATTDWTWKETLLQSSLPVDENLALADTLTAALQKTQVNCTWTPGPQEL